MTASTKLIYMTPWVKGVQKKGKIIRVNKNDSIDQVKGKYYTRKFLYAFDRNLRSFFHLIIHIY
jgi:uncharacterized protein YhbP (UPF0306 family)